MEDDPKLQALAALTVLAAAALLVVQFAGRRSAPAASSGPGWYSRLNPFGVAPSPGPAPAAPRSAPDLAPPEPMMTKAATRRFSSPSSGGAGGIAGVEAPAAAGSAAAPAPHLNAASVNIPGGGRSPVAGGAAPRSGSPGSASGPVPGRGGSGAGFAGGASAPGGGGARPKGGAPAAASAGAGLSGGGGGGGGGGGSGSATADGRAPDLQGSTPPPGEELKVPDKTSGGDFLGSGRGGSLGGDGGGGGGDSASALGGGLPGGAKPKSSAGKPEGGGAASASGGPSAAPAGPGGPAGAGAKAAGGDIVAGSPVIGAPQLGTTTANGGMFRLYPGGPLEVPTVVHTTRTGAQVVVFQAKMAIDADGAGEAWRGDATGQSQTALLYKNGDSLNPQTVPFIVVPMDFQRTHPRVGLGDYAAVTYGAKTLYAIVGDKGPNGVLGEGSMSLAAGLGINPDPNKGGITRKDVRYAIIPGTRDPEPPRDGAVIQTRGRAIFEAAGAPVR